MFSGVAVAVGAVVTAAFEGRGTICAIGARQRADGEGTNVSTVSTGLKVVGSLDFKVAVIRKSSGFECCCASFFGKSVVASTVSFAGWAFSSFWGDGKGVAQVTDASDSDSEMIVLVAGF